MSETKGDWTGNLEASAGEESSFDRDQSVFAKRCGMEAVWESGAES